MNLEAIEKRCEAATPGPWEEKTNRHPQCNGEPWGWIGGASGNITWSGNSGKTNASFIAHAREDIPALIAEVKSLTTRAEKAERERDKAVEDLYKACKGTPCNTGICVTKNCTGNHIPCEFEWRGPDEKGDKDE